ncbi:MAG: DUF1015 family protein [Clostridiales Family XIII bacterium]|nr:DUF1015 family protein [Clostridiales Family XIII bacterium]
MAIVKSFKAVRPVPQYAEQVAALPYDVMNSAEARVMVSGNPHSFLHVDKAEIDLDPAIDVYDEQVYLKARDNLEGLISSGILAQDAQPGYYIYRLTMDGRAQTGLVGCCAIDDYLNDVIKKHEKTRADKEADRIHHVDTLDANTGPIFLTCRSNDALNDILDAWVRSNDSVYDFTADDDVRHEVWVIGGDTIGKIESVFGGIPALYIADGHHRCASAVNVGQKRRAENPGYTGDEDFNYFLAVVFPEDQLKILDYNRVVADLAGDTPAAFLGKLSAHFDIAAHEGADPFKPQAKHSIGLYLDGKWYGMTAKPATYEGKDTVGSLDVSILQNYVLGPILGIEDPRTDKRIDFIGGIRGLGELERRVSDGMAAAFAMYPTSVSDLMNIADAGLLMPPKSTWFEPKLRSGLFIHKLS